MDARHFVIIEFRHLAKGCTLKCGCIGLMLFRNLSMSGHTFVTLWLQVVQPLANVHETKWTPHVKQESDVAQSIRRLKARFCLDSKFAGQWHGAV